jgi:isochorismate synthase
VSGEAAVLRHAVRESRVEDGARRIASMRRAVEAIAHSQEGAHGRAAASIGRGPALPPLAAGAAREEADLASTDPEAWSAMVLDALSRIRAGELRKVVPASVQRVPLARPADTASVIALLSASYPECHVFAFQRGSATFVGASPERLVTLRGLCVEADALAGSIRRGAEDDAREERALASSEKDLREHAHVVEAVSGALRPLCRALHVPAWPKVRSFRNVHHLYTPIAGDLERPGHVLDLVEILHPTPAVCGAPRDAAIAWIASHEAVPRGWYAGAVGWFDEDGDGAFSVAIRSGLLSDREAWIYAGAGIVEGSDPASEYAETRVKQAPMLAALGVLSA